MSGKKRLFKIPETVFVQRVVDGDDSYLVAYDNIADIDIEGNGNIVHVFDYFRTIKVSESPRTIEEV